MRRLIRLCSLMSMLFLSPAVVNTAAANESSQFIDLSLMISREYPCWWPDFSPPFRMIAEQRIGRASAYNVDALIIDGNCGTQMDVPAHSVTPPEMELPNSGPFGKEFSDTTPPWKFAGEACIVDVQKIRDAAANGVSPRVIKKYVTDWEKQHRQFRLGDVVVEQA